MPVTTTTAFATQTRLADAAVSARGDANLLRQTFDDGLPANAFKAQGDGTVLVEGMDLLKSGTFYGMMGAISLTDEDLSAMVVRFAQLADSGIFLPPFRLDHSWSVLSVVGWFESIETYRRVDSTDNMEKAFLRGNVRITGSVDYTADQIVSAMKRKALRNRSSEVGYYVTNSGVELPLVFYGCAYVDIPAVEGLAPVEGLRSRPVPHSITTLSATKGTPTMTPEQRARLAALRAQVTLSADEEVERDELEALDQSSSVEETGETGAGVPTQPEAGEGDGGNAAAAGDGTADESGSQATGGGETGPDAGDVEDPPPAEGTPEPAPDATASAGDPVAELAAARAEIARLRNEGAQRQIANLRTAGAITDRNETAALALLSHSDDTVREHASTILGTVVPPVQLGRKQGRQELQAGQNAAQDGDGLIRLGMPKDEAVSVWTSLSTAERKLRQPEYDAWSRDRQEKGIRD